MLSFPGNFWPLTLDLTSNLGMLDQRGLDCSSFFDLDIESQVPL